MVNWVKRQSAKGQRRVSEIEVGGGGEKKK